MNIRFIVACAAALMLAACGQSGEADQAGEDEPKAEQAAAPKSDNAVFAASTAGDAPQALPKAAIPKVDAGDWDRMVECARIYRSIESGYSDYFHDDPMARRDMKTREYKQHQVVVKASRDAVFRLTDAGKALQGDIPFANAIVSEGRRFAFSNVNDRARACDAKFGFQVATILPALKPPAPKPTTSLKGIDTSVSDCETLKALAAAYVGEVAYVRSQRIQRSDPNIVSEQLNASEAYMLAMNLSERSVECGYDAPMSLINDQVFESKKR